MHDLCGKDFRVVEQDVNDGSYKLSRYLPREPQTHSATREGGIEGGGWDDQAWVMSVKGVPNTRNVGLAWHFVVTGISDPDSDPDPDLDSLTLILALLLYRAWWKPRPVPSPGPGSTLA